MSKIQRVTLTLPADLLAQARQMSKGNLSHYIGNILREHFEYKRLEQLRDALIAGAIANAEDDLEIAEAFRYAEDEAVALYVPPYGEDEAAELNITAASGQE
jgi:hypothetical protein